MSVRWRVMKFGGTSLAGAERLRAVVDLVRAALAARRVLVVASAMAGVTDLLLAGIAAAEAGGTASETAGCFHAMHRKALEELRPELGAELAAEAARRLEELAAELARLLQGIALLRACPPAARARIGALGERAACALLACLARSGGLDCLELDPCRVLACTGDPLEATPVPHLIRERLAGVAQGAARLALLPGFFGGDEQGQAVLLGRGGSDLSAALAAAALEAELLEIWTDVDGIFTADPRLVPSAACLPELSFEEAMELAYFGAKVLHPRTIAPLRGPGVAVRVCNSFHPERPGTLVHGAAALTTRPARGVSLLAGVALLDISGPGMRGVPGVASRAFAALAGEEINVVLITQGSSECAISICVAEASAAAAVELLDGAFVAERMAGLMDDVALRRELAILTLVGDGMRDHCAVSGTLFGTLGDLGCNVVAIAQGSSERSISAVIPAAEGARALASVHGRFFDGCERLELYLMGVGLVGKQFLVQLRRQQTRMRERGLDLRLCAVADSRRLLLDPTGIDPERAPVELTARGAPLAAAALAESVRARRPTCPVLVDCTSSAALAADYAELAAAGFHVVGANKKLNSGPLAGYRALRAVLSRHSRRFHYETNVGAGLPVLRTLRDLLAGGDRVRRIEGIFSGSLSFILGLLEDGVPFSAAVRRARQEGYTEPDPRDDLSCLDMARKALIVHRELGGELELDQVRVEGLLPAGMGTGRDGAAETAAGAGTGVGTGEATVESFLEEIAGLDEEFAGRVDELRGSGRVLRLVATIDEDGCHVGPLAVGSEHPLFSVRGGECAVSFSSDAYSPRPLVVRGYGAGAEVTAAAVLADVMRLAQGTYR
jgi:aspartokinase/homoserine dehydrogenase 1